MVARRMLFPLSGLTVTSARPRLRWNAADVGATVIQICSERTCGQPWVTESTTATTFMPSADIPPGYWFWRIRPQGDANGWTAPWLFRVRRRFPGYQPVANTAAEPFADFNGDGIPDAPGGTDFNGDGYSDTGREVTAVEAACPWDNQKLSRVRYGGPTGLTDGPLFPVDRGWDPLWVAAPFGVGDLDGDGYGEMVGLMRYGAYLVRGCGGAPPSRAEPHAVKCGSCQAASVQAGDFDGDALTDFLYLSTDGATIMFGNASATRTTEFHVAPVAWVLDYNYDGFSDFIAEASSGMTGQVSGWLGGPDGLTANPTPLALPPLSQGAFLFGDFDGDGTWDRIDGTGVTYGGPQARTATTPRAVAARALYVVDINGDNFDDAQIDGTWYFGSPQG